MPETKILVDTNSYFRLAQSIRPLLGQFICMDSEYSLYIIKELEGEYISNPRLKNKFSWVSLPEYVENRKEWTLKPQRKKTAIDDTFKFVLETARSNYPNVSKTDIRYIAYAIEFSIPISTDDTDMLSLAKDYGIDTFKTLEIMKLMLDCGHIDNKEVKSIAEYMQYSLDIPKSFMVDFKRLFGYDFNKLDKKTNPL